MLFLRSFLARTVDLQAFFIIQRFRKSVPYTLRQISSEQRVHVKKQLYRVARSPLGLYALIDYLNFKGLINGNLSDIIDVEQQIKNCDAFEKPFC